VEYEVRAAYLDLRAADEQLQAAQDAVGLANQELEQTRDRSQPACGISGAGESVATSTRIRVCLYAHNLAKATLAHAIGEGYESVAKWYRSRAGLGRVLVGRISSTRDVSPLTMRRLTGISRRFRQGGWNREGSATDNQRALRRWQIVRRHQIA
jgi:hypothetical protein